jgi:maltokinase
VSRLIAESLPGLVVRHLPDHLVRQRWAGASNRTVAEVELLWHELVLEDEPYLLWTVAHARFADGGEQDYQLFVGARGADHQPDFLHGKEREILAVAAKVDGDGELVLYDALVDPDLAIAVLHLAAPDIEVEVRRPIVLEHSNSSVVFDETTILKIFRKVEPGPNPDVEITRVLAESGYEHVLEPLAELERDGTDLAVLRRFLVGAVEGWTLARTSVRDLLASREEPADAGADFSPEAERLGGILADLHLRLAAAWGFEPGRGADWAADMRAQLAELDAVEGLDRDAIAGRYDELAALPDVGAEVHIHGDLHLAQVIQSDIGWIVLDFEGEPARRRADRFTTSSPLRDVAGMLRSFHYAAAVGRADWGDDAELDLLALGWEELNRRAFLDGYFQTAGIDMLLPADLSARETVQAAFELDKAVYEVAYELGHRPDQVGIPLAGIERLLPSPA